jgi:fatty-acyl-CoA synthase
VNEALEARLASPTITEALRRAAADGLPGPVFHLEEGPVPLPIRDLAAAALSGARRLRSAGVSPGDRVGVLGPNRPQWIKAAAAVWAAGAALVPLPYHLRIRDPDAFAEQTGSLIRAAGCRSVIVDQRFSAAVPDGMGLDWDELAAGETGVGNADWADPWGEMKPPREGDLAVVQFTSGSTASPKGVMLTHAAVMAMIRNYAVAEDIRPGEDTIAGWLPFFHDWGLFGFLVRPLVCGCTAHLLPTERFAGAPRRWLQLLSDTKATMTGGPPSAMLLAVRAAARRPEGIDLSSLRQFGLGAEKIDPATVDEVLLTGSQWGLDPTMFCAGYGMAETTLVVTMTPIGKGVRIDVIDSDELAAGRAVPARDGKATRVTGAGYPIPLVEMRIQTAEGPAAERRVGEIQVRGPSLMQGYLGGGPQEPFECGWLRTGDTGYLADGYLFVVGRIKDLIIVYGRNYAPEEVEWAAARVPGVRPGRVVAFSPPGEAEGTVVLALEAAARADPADLTSRVRRAVTNAIGITPRVVLVVPKSTIERTTSGKLRRAAIAEAYARADLPITATG